MSVAKARCHVVRTIARSEVRFRIAGTLEDGLTKFCNTLALSGHDRMVMHILKPIVSRRYLLKRMTLEEKEIQVLQQLV
jgi:hypothetical protein